RHPAAGVILTDLFRNTEFWLVDEGLETWLSEGMVYATRYYTPDCFSMTAGVGMPVDLTLLRDALESVPPLLRRPVKEVVEARRFAEAIYRRAIADGIMERVGYKDPPGTDAAA